MRVKRIKPEEGGVQHCVSHLVDGLSLEDFEKETFRQLMWHQAAFCGAEIITYNVMGNHYHILTRFTPQDHISDAELLERVKAFYGPEAAIVQRLEEKFRATGKFDEHERTKLMKRLGDVSVFMKELKESFTKWYNKRHDRKGTLWAARFKNVVIEPTTEAIQTVAAYIDLNPIRAGMEKDPKDYRFCGYTEALATGGKAREGLCRYLEGKTDTERMENYRVHLMKSAGRSGHSDKKVLDREEILEVLRKGGKVDLAELNCVRVRYFTDGLIFGSQAFIEAHYQKRRGEFSEGRQSGARRMKGADWGGLRVFRALRVRVFG